MGRAVGAVFPPRRTDCFNTIWDEHEDMFIERINKNTKKTVIFTALLGVAKHVHKRLNERGIGAILIVGETKDRTDAISKFKDTDAVDVLVATSQTLSTGVTLTEADLMFVLGTPWRDTDFKQLTDRIARIGQTTDAYIYTVFLDTGKEKNVSSRMKDVLIWSEKMFKSFIANKEGEISQESVMTGKDLVSEIKEIYEKISKFPYDEDTTHTRPMKEFMQEKTGVCYDTVNYMYFKTGEVGDCYYITANTPKNRKILRDNLSNHTIILFPHGKGKCLLVESSFEGHKGMHVFESPKEAIEQMIKWMKAFWKKEKGITEEKPIEMIAIRYKPDNKRHNVQNGDFEDYITGDGYISDMRFQ